jgi:hypothetical protein
MHREDWALRAVSCGFVSHTCAERSHFSATKYNNLADGVSGLRRSVGRDVSPGAACCWDTADTLRMLAHMLDSD